MRSVAFLARSRAPPLTCSHSLFVAPAVFVVGSSDLVGSSMLRTSPCLAGFATFLARSTVRVRVRVRKQKTAPLFGLEARCASRDSGVSDHNPKVASRRRFNAGLLERLPLRPVHVGTRECSRWYFAKLRPSAAPLPVICPCHTPGHCQLLGPVEPEREIPRQEGEKVETRHTFTLSRLTNHRIRRGRAVLR